MYRQVIRRQSYEKFPAPMKRQLLRAKTVLLHSLFFIPPRPLIQLLFLSVAKNPRSLEIGGSRGRETRSICTFVIRR